MIHCRTDSDPSGHAVVEQTADFSPQDRSDLIVNLIVAAIDRRLGAQAPGASPKPGAGRPPWRSRAHDTASA